MPAQAQVEIPGAIISEMVARTESEMRTKLTGKVDNIDEVINTFRQSIGYTMLLMSAEQKIAIQVFEIRAIM